MPFKISEITDGESMAAQSPNTAKGLVDSRSEREGHLARCPAHPEEETAVFCTSCDRGICITCVTQNTHGQHQLCKVEDITHVKQSEFKDFVQTEDSYKIHQRLKKYIGEIPNQKETVAEHQRKTNAFILHRAEHLIKTMHKIKQDLIASSKSSTDQHLRLLSDREAMAKRCVLYLEKYSNDPNSLTCTSREDMIQVMRDFRSFQSASTALENGLLMSFKTGPNLTEEQVHKLFGTLNGYTGSLNQGTAKLGNPNENCTKLLKKFHVIPASYLRTYENAMAIARISPIDADKAYILMGNGYLYKIQLAVAEIQLDTLEPIARDVNDVTQLGDRGLYFCTNSTVQLCTSDGQLFVLDSVAADNTTQFCSICMTKEGHILICSKQSPDNRAGSNDCYCVLNSLDQDGVHIPDASQSRQTPLRDTGLMNRMERHRNDIFFLGRQGYLKGLIINGETSKSVYEGRLGSNPAKTFDPRGMCCDQNDQVIIADNKNSALHLLDKDWKFKKFLLREWDGITHPTAIALHQGCLWIGQEDGIIQIRKYKS